MHKPREQADCNQGAEHNDEDSFHGFPIPAVPALALIRAA
jgi:hypothetical protein